MSLNDEISHTRFAMTICCISRRGSRQFKLSLFFVIKREYPQGVGDKINSAVALLAFFVLCSSVFKLLLQK